MTASLPDEVQAVFDRFITTELTTVNGAGQPITWPVTPYYSLGDPCIDVTTGLGYPKKANDARANPLVSLLFSDPTGSGLQDPPMILVQGCAEVDDRDLEANRERYQRESLEKLPATASLQPPDALKRMLTWYYARIYIHIRPERVYVWPRGDIAAEPTLYDAHMEEVRSGHSEEPARFHASPGGGALARVPRRLPVLGSGAREHRCGGALDQDRGRARGDPLRPRPRMPDRARARRRVHLAAELPGQGRPQAGRQRLGSGASQARRRV
jgi:hypothetical protein